MQTRKALFATLLSCILPWRKRLPAVRWNDLHIQLYTRRGCHLCETAAQQLRTFQAQYPFQLTEVDIDTQPELVPAYGELVPVVTVNGKIRFRGGVNALLLRRLLAAEASKRRPY